MKNSVSTVYILFLCIGNSFAQVPFIEGDMYGFKEGGKITIAPKFEYATHFSEGLACVQQNGKWGYIDRSGKWMIEPKFISAQPMRKAKAKVKGENGVGLIDSLGNIIVPMEFSSIEERWDDYQIEKNGKKGVLKNGWKLIPPNYLEIETVGKGLIYAKKSNNLYDVYSPNGLFLENQKKEVEYLSYGSDYNCILQQNGKYGIYLANKNSWVEEPMYEYIHMLHTNEYYYGKAENGFNQPTAYYILALFKELNLEGLQNESLNIEISNASITLKTIDCQQILCENITGYRAENSYLNEFDIANEYTLYRGDKIGRINSEVIVTDPIYEKFQVFGEGEIRISENKGEYFNAKGELIFTADTLASIEYYSDEYFDETGEFFDFTIYTIPYILIAKKGEYSFLYNLLLEQETTPNLPYNTEYSVIFPNKDFDPEEIIIEFSYDNKKGCKPAFDLPCSALKYDYFQYGKSKNYTLAIFQNEDLTETSDLLNYNNPKEIICSANEIILSDNWSYHIDHEMEIEYWTEEIPYFKNTFYILKTNTKYGVFTPNQKIITPKYDTLIAYENDANFIVTKIGENYGVINLETGIVIEPCYNEFPTIAYSDFTPDFYLYFPSKDGMQYYGNNNHWYPSNKCSFEAIEAENGKYAIQIYSEGVENPTLLFEPKYEFIRETEYQNYYTATLDGKIGLINPFDDIIVPFEYSSIHDSEFSVEYNREFYTSFLLKKGKKRGLFVEKMGIIIPAEYDYLEPVYGESGILKWIVKNKKYYSLLDSIGNTILPAIYSRIESVDDGDLSNTIYVNDKKKKAGLFHNNQMLIEPAYGSLDVLSIYQNDILGDFVVDIHNNKKNGVYFHSTGKIIPPLFEFIEYDSSNELLKITKSVTVHSKNGMGIYNIYGDEVISPIYEDVYLHMENDLLDFPIILGYKADKFFARVYDTENNQWMHKFESTILFDQVNSFEGIVFEPGKITKYDLKTGEIKNTIDHDNFTIELNSGTLIKENGKFGYITSDKETKLEPIFSTIEYKLQEDGVLFGIIDGVNYYLNPWSGTIAKQSDYEEL